MLQLDHEAISALHCSISGERGHYLLQDLGSTNGTFVNDRKVERMSIRDGDMLRFGQLDFRFETPLELDQPDANSVPKPTDTVRIAIAAPAPAPAAPAPAPAPAVPAAPATPAPAPTTLSISAANVVKRAEER